MSLALAITKCCFVAENKEIVSRAMACLNEEGLCWHEALHAVASVLAEAYVLENRFGGFSQALRSSCDGSKMGPSCLNDKHRYPHPQIVLGTTP
jgi:hypothetical protein